MATQYLSKFIPFVVGAALSSTAMAATITFDPITASWENGVPTSNVKTYSPNSTNPKARWGGYSSISTPSSSDSGYDFQTAATPLSILLPPNASSALFDLGTFTHINNPIPSGSSITAIDLVLNTHVYVDNAPVGTKEFNFKFTHEETPNAANPCANDGINGSGVNTNGCADKVTTSWLGSSQSFSVDGVDYTLNIWGFQVGGQDVTEFWTKEELSNDAHLLAQVVSVKDVQPVPEPASLALMGMGLASLAGLRRRRRAA